MDISAIASMSMEMKMEEATAAVEMAMLKKAMDLDQAMAAELLRGLENALPTPLPSFGHRLDVLA